MLSHVTIVERRGFAISSSELGALRTEFPGVGIRVQLPAQEAARARPSIRLDAGAFWAEDFDAHRVDGVCEELAGQGDFGLRLEGDAVSARTVEAVLTRFQRFLGRRNPASAGPAFDRVLACHRALHDCDKPLVRADLDHALDTWHWVLRLDPGASAAVQAAALFHDVERLVSEADERIEQHASDYRAFKDEHARRGGLMTRDALAGTGLDAAVIDRAADLVADHERPGDDAERRLLNEADALSFFSLNSTGFLGYYGVEHTRRKIAYTLARLREGAWWRLARIRYHPAVAGMLQEAQAQASRTQAAMPTIPTRQGSHDERDPSSPA
jgi:hypothetical protein